MNKPISFFVTLLALFLFLQPLMAQNVATPVLSYPSGTYNAPISITISCDTVGVEIYYIIVDENELDENEPDENDPQYTGPIDIDGPVTLKAKAFLGEQSSATASAVYKFKVNTPDITPIQDTHEVVNELEINISCDTEGATISYAIITDGGQPSWEEYDPDDPPVIIQNCIVKAKASKGNWIESEEVSKDYYLKAVSPVISPDAGTYIVKEELPITLTSATEDDIIRYTLDESEPTESSITYNGQFNIAQNTTVKAKVFRDNWLESETVSSQIILKAFKPETYPPPEVYNKEQDIALTSKTNETTIHYTLDFSDPTPSSPEYTESITITQNTTVKARAFRDEWESSEVSIFSYILMPPIPVFDPPAGSYNNPLQVKIKSTDGAQIRYTTDGSEPTPSSPEYKDPILITQNTTVKARAYLTGWTRSEVGSASYIMPLEPETIIEFNPPGGTYTQAKQVLIYATGLPDGSELRYTLDGSDPDTNSTLYQNETIDLALNSQTTIKVRVFHENHSPSAIWSASYIITGTIELPQLLFYPPPGNYAEELFITTHGLPSPNHAVLRFTTDGTDPSDDSPVLPTIIPLNPGSTLNLKVGAFLDDWISSEIHHAFYQCIEYPSLVNIDETYNFYGSRSSDYRLVGLPGMTSHPIELFMAGSHLTDWKAFREGGRIQGADLIDSNLIPWSRSNSFSFTPGAGYWLLSKEPIHISLPVVASVPLNRELGYSIPIHHGWNIISNPFPKPIRWDNVRKVNAGTEYEMRENLYSFNNGVWFESSTMYPYMAYYFYNRRPNCSSLLIPYLNPEASEESNNPDTAPGCQIILNGPKETFSLKVGAYPASAETLDAWALYAPPLDFCSEYLSLEDGILKQEYRSSTNQVFNFKLKTDYSASPHLSFVLDEGSPDFYLWDKADDSLHQISSAFEYPLAPCHTNFALVTGSELFVQDLENSLMPQATVVANNRPNPFSGYTSIKAGFSSDVTATVEVFNVRGQRMAILADDAQIKAGNREWTFDATSLPSGLYFCRVSWNDGKTKNQKTIKMIHVK